jgi:membrane protein
VVAAGVAFYVFLALVPALIAVISVYGLVAQPADVQRQLESVLAALPPDAADLVLSQVQTIVEQGSASLGFGLVVSVVAALLAASKGMLAMVAALNIAYDEDETRKFLRLRALALLLTVGVAVGAVLGVGGMVIVANVAEALGIFGEIALTVLRWPVLAALAALALAVLYRYAPDRDPAAWRWVTPGAIAATLLWLVASAGFSLYVRNVGSYNETYGSLAAVVVLLLWLFLTAYAAVFGAELDSEAERQTVKDSTDGPGQPLGRRQAYAADTVARD